MACAHLEVKVYAGISPALQREGLVQHKEVINS